MKKFLTFFLSSAIFLSSLSVLGEEVMLMSDELTPALNTLLNGDFSVRNPSATTKPAVWTAEGSWRSISGWGTSWPMNKDPKNIFLLHRGDEAHQGVGTVTKQTVEIEKNKNYELSFWYKSNVDFTLQITLDDATTDYNIERHITNTTQTAENKKTEFSTYKQYRLDISSGDAESLTIAFRDDSGKGETWTCIDAVEFIVNPDDGIEEPVNAGFEDKWNDNRAKGWTRWAIDGMVSSDEDAKTGNSSLKVPAESVGSTAGQNIKTLKETDYLLSWFGKGEGKNYSVTVYGLEKDTNEKYELAKSENISAGSVWEKKILSFNSAEFDYIRIEITAGEGNNALYLDEFSLNHQEMAVNSFDISGYSAAGQNLIANIEGKNITQIDYLWQVSDDGVSGWIDIEGAEDDEYILDDAFEGKYIRIKAICKDIKLNGDVLKSEEMYSKVLYVGGKSVSSPVDIKDKFNGLYVAAEKDAKNKTDETGTFEGYLLNKDNLKALVGKSNAVVFGEIPYYIDFNGELFGIGEANGDLVIDFENEYLNKINLLMTYSVIPASEQKAVITFSDGTFVERIFIPGSVFEKTIDAESITDDAIGMISIGENGSVDNEKGYLYSYTFDVSRVAEVKSISFPNELTEGKAVVLALTKENVDKEIIKNKISEELSGIPGKVKPSDFEIIDTVEESVNKLLSVYEQFGGDISELPDCSEEYFGELRVKAIVNAYNDGDLELVSDGEGGFAYADILKLSELDKDGATVYSLYDSLLTKEGKLAVQNALCKNNFSDADKLKDEILVQIVLKAIEYPNVGGVQYIADILTEENIEKIGLSCNDYLKALNKSSYHSKIAGKKYNTLDALEEALKAEKKTTSTGGSGGGSSGGSTGITIPPKTEEIKKTESVDLTMFKDVTEEHWAYKAVYRLKELEIVNGKSKDEFVPEGTVKREEFLKMLCEALKIQEVAGENSKFNDVENGAWYEKYVNIAVSNGIVSGMGNDMFGTGLDITRQDLCVMAVRASGKESEEITENSDFSDFSGISDYAKPAVSYLVKQGVINGFDDNTFRPFEKCTRAQAAKIIYSLMDIVEG